MIYKKFRDVELSALGFGTMRLPTIDGKFSAIDEKLTREMFDYAIKHGVNYFDTAWGYHDGESENTVGKILSEYDRSSFYLASKFPGYDLSNMGKVEEIFERQLKKCRVDYFDFYLIHNVCEMNIEQYLDERYGTMAYLLDQKDNGRIKHLGFSVHGSIEVTKRFLDKYGKYMEFGQVQLNYLDWEFQDAKLKVEMLDKLGIPVWVMEPLRGGKLAKLDEKYERELKKIRADETVPAMAFRFLQSIPNVTMILSGMSDFEQVKSNIATFDSDKPLDARELKAIFAIADDMIKESSLPCTACRYGTSHCPKGLDIPELIRLYNEHCFTGGGFLAPMVLGTYSNEKLPNACVGCGSCEAVCPQQIKVSEMMKDFSSRLK